MPTPRTIAASIVALTLLVAACGDDDDNDAADTTESTDQATTTSTSAPTEDTEPAAAAAVAIATSELGEVLVDAEGFTLYLFDNDTAGASACQAGCIEQWPPAAAEADLTVGEGLDQAIFGTITRDDGSVQLTVNDLPLYRYVEDQNPGDTSGQGVGGIWWVVGPDGMPIEG